MSTDSRVRQVVRRGTLLATVVILGGAAQAAAQAPARTFQELGKAVTAGDTVYISDNTGHADHKAKILNLTSSLLAAEVNGVRHDFAEANVTRIRQRTPDSRMNGMLIGFLIGGAAATAGAVTMASPSGSCTGGCIGMNILYGGGVGSLVGLGVDSLVQSRRDIYVKADSLQTRRIGIRPFAHPQGGSLQAALRF